MLDALKGVKDPDLGRDLVDLGMIKDIRIGDGTVALTVNLTTPACPLKAQIERDVRTALESRLPGEWNLQHQHGAPRSAARASPKSGDIPGIKNVIAVGSGKGGVGKSTMAAAIAYGLRSYGAKVGLMDADVYGPSIPHLVGASGRPMARGDRIQPIETNGLKLMSMGFLLEPDTRRDHARADAARDHAAVPPPGRLGPARLPGDRPAARDRRRAADPGPDPAADRRRGRLHAPGSRPARRHPRHHDVPPASKVPVLGMIENMAFFDVLAYLKDRGGPEARPAGRRQGASSTRPATSGSTSSAAAAPGARPSELGVPFLGEVPLNIHLRETRRRGQDGASPCCPARPRGPICWASSSSLPPRSASRTSRPPRCPSSRS